MICTCVRCGVQFEAKRKTAVCANCHTAVCVICGKEFQLQTPWTQKTCSSKCRAEYVKQSGIAKERAKKASATVKKNGTVHVFTKKCAYCGKEFQTTSSRQIYCNDTHYGPCPVCGKPVVIKEMYIGPQACSKECKQVATKATCLEKYGSTTAVNSDHARAKAKQTCLAKYGVEHPSQSIEYREKYEATMLDRYGVKYPLQSSEILNRVKQTNLERYGTEFPSGSVQVKQQIAVTMQSKYGGFGYGSDVLRDKIVATNVQKYGVAVPSKSNTVKQKMKRTMQMRYHGAPINDPDVRAKSVSTSLVRYGVKHPSQSDAVKHKVVKTMLQRYGVDNAFKSEEIKDKIKQTNLDKLGVDNPMKSEEIRNKARATNVERYGTEWYNSSVLSIERRMTDPTKLNIYLQFVSDPVNFIVTNYIDSPTLTELSRDTGVDVATISAHVLESNAQQYISYHVSTMERDIVLYIKSIAPDIKIVQHDRSMIYPNELDIYLPDYHVGIECNPTVTHNSSRMDPWSGAPKHYRYHQQKSIDCRNNGVFLFHVFGYEWTWKRDIILSMIKNLLGKSDVRMFARNTQVVELTDSECREFLNANHRQGAMFASIRLGLKDKQTHELVSVMTFNKIRSTIGKKSSTVEFMELSRFCSRLNTCVVGGASKLFSYYLKHHLIHNVVSFSDVAHTRGNLYAQLGFVRCNESAPSYVWVDSITDKALNRVECQKSNLVKLLDEPDLDLSQTERQIMESHGYLRVYDSGTVRWEYHPN